MCNPVVALSKDEARMLFKNEKKSGVESIREYVQPINGQNEKFFRIHDSNGAIWYMNETGVDIFTAQEFRVLIEKI